MKLRKKSVKERLGVINASGLFGSRVVGRPCGDLDELSTLPERIHRILNIVLYKKRKPGYMICFIMYDITSNKVRSRIAKYLLGKGCTRIQKSIFMADLPASAYDEINEALVEVQRLYENNDSILIVPLSEDYVKAMKVIGQQVDMDLMMHEKTTLFL